MTNQDGNQAREQAECRDILADPHSPLPDKQAARERLADLNHRSR